MAAHIEDFSFSPFPADEHLWCLAWYGKLHLGTTSTEPLIEVFLIPYIGETFSKELLVTQVKSYRQNDVRVCRIGVGQLPGLTMGSFWKARRQVRPKPDLGFRRETFTLTINEETTIITSPEEEGFRNVNGRTYPINRLSPRLPMCRIARTDAENSFIFVPCVEVFRFYYGRSTPLAVSLLSGGMLGSNQLYSPDYTMLDPETGIGHVKLRQRMKDEDAGFIARIAFSEIARREAQRLQPRLFGGLATGKGPFIQIRPPFEGLTEMTLEGKRILDKESGSYHFLGMRILSCTGEFPFMKTSRSRDNDGNEDGEAAEDQKEITRSISIERLAQPLPEEKTMETGKEPDLVLEKTDVFTGLDAFPDLTRKLPIERKPKGYRMYKSAKNRTLTDRDITEFGTGEGKTNSGDIGPASMVRKLRSGTEETAEEFNRSGPIQASLTLFGTILEEGMRMFPGLTVWDYQEDPAVIERTSQAFCIYFPKQLDGRRASWCYLDEERRFRRSAMVAGIILDGHHYVLMDIQKRDWGTEEKYTFALYWREDFAKMTPTEVSRVIVECARRRGVWRVRNSVSQDYKLKTFIHCSPSPMVYAFRIFTEVCNLSNREDLVNKAITNTLVQSEKFPD